MYRIRIKLLVVIGFYFCVLASIAEEPASMLSDANQVGWSFESTNSEITISISPAGQTLRFAGSAGLITGTIVSAVQNDKYRQAIEEAIADYDCVAVFEERLAERLEALVDTELVRVATMQSTAGYNTVREARDDRFEALREAGNDVVVDFKIDYGLFGYEGLLITKLEARVYDADSGHLEWKESVVASPENMLASDKLKDPTGSMIPSTLRLTASEDAVEQWTGDGGETFRTRYEAAVDGSISAMLVAMGLVEEPLGSYYLGKLHLMRKDFEEAREAFGSVLASEPGHLGAMNGLSVTLGHDDEVEQAIEMAQRIVEDAPDFAPAHFNLAWWYAVEEDNAEAAAPHYAEAKALGLPGHKKIERKLD